MEYIDARNGDIKETNYLRLVNGDSQFRVELDNQNRLVITKVDFNDDTINIQPMVRNQIAIK